MKRLLCALLAGATMNACDDGGGSDYQNFCEGDPCGTAHVTCLQAATGPHCLCDQGYVFDSNQSQCINASEDDLCNLDCGSHGICIGTGDDSRCFCENGYEFRSDKKNCVAKENPCNGVTCGGEEKGKCAVVDGSAFCVCKDGYVQTSATNEAGISDVTCKDDTSNPCSTEKCPANALCALDTNNNARCFCLSSGIIVSDGVECRPSSGLDLEEKCDLNCGTHGHCMIDAAGKPFCICDDGYYYNTANSAGDSGTATKDGTDLGSGAETELCLPGQNSCENVTCSDSDSDNSVGACVLTAAGNARCICSAGYHEILDANHNPKCESDDINPCIENTCNDHGSCIANNGKAICICDEGYQQTPDKASCVNITSPCSDFDCNLHGQCVEKIVATEPEIKREALCICEPGYVLVGSTKCVAAISGTLPDYVMASRDFVKEHALAKLPYVSNRLIAYHKSDAGAFGVLQSSLALFSENHNAEARIVAYDQNVRRAIIELVNASDITNSVSDSGNTVDTTKLGSLYDDLKSITGPDNTRYLSAVSYEWLDSASRMPNDNWDGDIWTESVPQGANWYLEMIQAPSAWDYSTGARVKVGIIDFGINMHEEIVDNIAGTNYLTQSVSIDQRDHGTAVAGLIGAEGNNGQGVTGVLWSPAMYFCQTDGSLARLGDCLNWLAQNDVHIVNYSANHSWSHLSDTGTDRERAQTSFNGADELAAWEQELQRLEKNKQLLVVPAGNDAIEGEPLKYATPVLSLSDSLRKHTLVVGALSSEISGSRVYPASYTNRSTSASGVKVDVYAPGGDGELGDSNLVQNLYVLSGNSGYARSAAGTSYAAALVTGAAALAYSIKPDLTIETLRGYFNTMTSNYSFENNNILNVKSVVEQTVNACGSSNFNSVTGTCGCNVAFDCIGKRCGEEGASCTGVICNGPELNYCVGNTLYTCSGTIDCTSHGLTCGLDRSSNTYRCIQSCTPDCSDRECGTDTQCGVSCGSCWEHEYCHQSLHPINDGSSNAICYVRNAASNDVLPSDWKLIEPSKFAPESDYTYKMGCDGSSKIALETNYTSEECHNSIRHNVKLTHDFVMSDHEVTQLEWNRVMGNTAMTDLSNREKPITNVNWYEALAYCNALSALEGFEQCYNMTGCALSPGAGWNKVPPSENDRYRCAFVTFEGYQCKGYRLPTEAEWEFAARGGVETSCYTDVIDENNLVQCRDVTSVAVNNATAAVVIRSKSENLNYVEHPYGLYDILGNVQEWVWDVYESDYYLEGHPKTELESAVFVNPTGSPIPSSGNSRVVRGGSFKKDQTYLRATYREGQTAALPEDALTVGFRPVRTVR